MRLIIGVVGPLLLWLGFVLVVSIYNHQEERKVRREIVKNVKSRGESLRARVREDCECQKRN